METSTILMGCVIGLIIWAVILVYIIETGSKSKEIQRQMKIQSALLAKIAEHQGVDTSEIRTIISIKS